ncbi:hypothetical protein GALMADRAFT_220283 [Galerina marginata CBS 339.88]|uniref:Uncharacterized protein n=1 Tax=Galerina marginata (strain CBS 339.88) TaxID=685588 RepID=A0A067TQK3_GALM3|nr:hypothetical protein GALMADRAFT_220283 [Galerina marginata CBS 339.88]
MIEDPPLLFSIQLRAPTAILAQLSLLYARGWFIGCLNRMRQRTWKVLQWDEDRASWASRPLLAPASFQRSWSSSLLVLPSITSFVGELQNPHHRHSFNAAVVVLGPAARTYEGL